MTLRGRPITLAYRRGIYAGAMIPQRRILVGEDAARSPRELRRLVFHELFHFAWVRLGNPRRRQYERLLEAELRARAAGELGWSAEWRKDEITATDRRRRTRRWREYCCESFCDTGAYLFSGVARHPEYTLARNARAARRRWFLAQGFEAGLPV